MQPISLSSPVSAIFERWPEAVDVFVQHQMACPGCYLSKFETLEGALIIYQIEPQPFLDRLNQIIAASEKKHQ